MNFPIIEKFGIWILTESVIFLEHHFILTCQHQQAWQLSIKASVCTTQQRRTKCDSELDYSRLLFRGWCSVGDTNPSQEYLPLHWVKTCAIHLILSTANRIRVDRYRNFWDGSIFGSNPVEIFSAMRLLPIPTALVKADADGSATAVAIPNESWSSEAVPRGSFWPTCYSPTAWNFVSSRRKPQNRGSDIPKHTFWIPGRWKFWNTDYPTRTTNRISPMKYTRNCEMPCHR